MTTSIARVSDRLCSGRNLIGALGVPSGQLDDVTHDVFLLIHRKLGELRDPRCLNTWTAEFAVRVASDTRRSMRRRGAAEELRQDLVAIDQSDALIERQEGRALLKSMLERMPCLLREVFILVELDEKSGPEVANQLKIKANTVYSRLRLARTFFESEIALLSTSEVTSGIQRVRRKMTVPVTD